MEGKIVSSSKRFQNNAFLLLDQITQMVNIHDENINVSRLQNIRFLITGISKKILVKLFVNKTYSSWSKIKDRDLNYFKKNWKTFIPERFIQKCEIYANIILNDNINGNDLDEFWNTLDCLIKCSINCVYDGKIAHSIKNTTSSHIKSNIENIAKEWNVKLGIVVIESESSDESTSDD